MDEHTLQSESDRFPTKFAFTQQGWAMGLYDLLSMYPAVSTEMNVALTSNERFLTTGLEGHHTLLRR